MELRGRAGRTILRSTLHTHCVYNASRLLKSATEWTKCVFGASAEAVEAENLFFALGEPTPPMST